MTARHSHHTTMAAATAQRAAPVIGWVDGEAIPRARLDERLAALRRGPRAWALPAPGSREGRQLVRWTAHVLLTEQLCIREAARRGLTTDKVPDLDPLSAVQLGSITTAAWRSHPAVGAVFAAVVEPASPAATVSPPLGRWHLSIATAATAQAAASMPPQSIGWTTLEDIPTELAYAARTAQPGELVGPLAAGGAWHVVRVDEVVTQRLPGLRHLGHQVRTYGHSPDGSISGARKPRVPHRDSSTRAIRANPTTRTNTEPAVT